MFKQLLEYAAPYKKYFILTPFMVVIEALAELLLPYLMGKVVDLGVGQNDTGLVWAFGIAMIVVSLIGLVAGVAAARWAAVASQGFGYSIREAEFKHIQTFSFADVDKFSTASLVTRMTTDVKTLQQTAMEICRVLVRAPSLLVISLIICVRQNAKLTLVYCVAIPVLLLVVLTIMKFTHHLFVLMQTKFDNLNASVQENLIAIRVVKSFVRTDFEKKKFKVANDDLMKTSISATMRIIIMNPATTLILYATTLALYWFGGHLVGNGEMLSGQLVSFINYLNNILMSVMMFSMILMSTVRASACGKRVVEVLNHEADIKSPESPKEQEGRLQGEIRFDHVSFKYPQTDRKDLVLKDLSFTVEPGSFVAIVGATGVGKTSLVNLIPRFYDPTSGEIYVDGVNVKDYDLHHLRENVGMVLQNNVLFSGTIRENLQWGAPDGNDEELLEAAKDSQAYEFISRFPEGLDTVIEQGGVNVSGGQKQRLCIGRAMLKNPAILILDDSTSAVDSATEAQIRDTFYNKYRNTTVLLVAQRISSVQYADKIIVLEKGELSDMGTHDELMARSPVYQAIYASQQEGVTLNDGE
jgi:ATP-binding cassette subfamily B protein